MMVLSAFGFNVDINGAIDSVAVKIILSIGEPVIQYNIVTISTAKLQDFFYTLNGTQE